MLPVIEHIPQVQGGIWFKREELKFNTSTFPSEVALRNRKSEEGSGGHKQETQARNRTGNSGQSRQERAQSSLGMNESEAKQGGRECCCGRRLGRRTKCLCVSLHSAVHHI